MAGEGGGRRPRQKRGGNGKRAVFQLSQLEALHPERVLPARSLSSLIRLCFLPFPLLLSAKLRKGGQMSDRERQDTRRCLWLTIPSLIFFRKGTWSGTRDAMSRLGSCSALGPSLSTLLVTCARQTRPVPISQNVILSSRDRRRVPGPGPAPTVWPRGPGACRSLPLQYGGSPLPPVCRVSTLASRSGRAVWLGGCRGRGLIWGWLTSPSSPPASPSRRTASTKHPESCEAPPMSPVVPPSRLPRVVPSSLHRRSLTGVTAVTGWAPSLETPLLWCGSG